MRHFVRRVGKATRIINLSVRWRLWVGEIELSLLITAPFCFFLSVIITISMRLRCGVSASKTRTRRSFAGKRQGLYSVQRMVWQAVRCIRYKHVLNLKTSDNLEVTINRFTGLQCFHCFKYFMSSLSISARWIRKFYPDLSITYCFLIKLNFYFHERDSREPKLRTIALCVKCCKQCMYSFLTMLLIFFILLINYTIFYCVYMNTITHCMYFTIFSPLYVNSLRDTKKLTPYFNSA
jgi:hypothetical protein